MKLSFGDRLFIQQRIETSMSTVQNEFSRSEAGDETHIKELLPSRGVLYEVLKRYNEKVALLSTSRSKSECTALLSQRGLDSMLCACKERDAAVGPSDLAELCIALDVSPTNCIFVSDDPHCMAVGKAAGVQTVGVLTQDESAKQALGDSLPADLKTLALYRAGVNHVIASGLSELLDLIPALEPSPNPSSQGAPDKPPPRIGTVQYTSKRSGVSCEVNLDGTGASHISTGVKFLDYMIALLAQYGRFEISLVCCSRSVHWDSTVAGNGNGNGLGRSNSGGAAPASTAPISAQCLEDCATALGEAFDQTLGSRASTRIAGSAYGTVDEALYRAVLQFNFNTSKVGGLSTESVEQNFRSFALACRINLHITCLYSAHSRHQVGAAFKALGGALAQALTIC